MNAHGTDHVPDAVVGHLVVAMLTVNNWALEKAWAILPKLTELELCDPQRLSALSHDEIFARLKRAGYTKSDYVVGLLADRLREMAKVMATVKPEKLTELMEPGHEKDRDQFFLALKGVGPAVLESFVALQGGR